MRNRFNGFLVFLLVFSITFFSVSDVGVPFSGLSVVFHFSAYFLLAGGLLLLFHDSLYGHFEAVVLSSFTGYLMEIIQLGIPFRSFSWFDVFMNCFGALFVLLDHRIGFVSAVVRAEDRFLESLSD